MYINFWVFKRKLIFKVIIFFKSYIMEEIWKDCGESKLKKYEVSNLGRVKSIDKKNGIEKILKERKHSGGYLNVHILGGNKYIHKLVIIAFKGEVPIGCNIDHINRIKEDNRLENLRYSTFSENSMNTSRYRNDILETDKVKRNKIIDSLNQRIRNAKKKLENNL